MRNAARLIEAVLLFSVLGYAATLTQKWVGAEKRASYLQGQRDLTEAWTEIETSPKRLQKW